MFKLKYIVFSLLLALMGFFFACTRWEFERTEFFQVITIGTVEVQANFAILIGDVANQKATSIVESGFVVSPVANDAISLQVDEVNTQKFPISGQDTLSTNQAFAVNANGLSPATTYYFRAYAQLEGVDEILYGEIDQFTTTIPVIDIQSASKIDPGCQTTVEVKVDLDEFNPTDPDLAFGLVWSNDLNNHYPNLDNGNVTSIPGDDNTLLLEIQCDQTYFVRAFVKATNGNPIYSQAYAFTTINGGIWQERTSLPTITPRLAPLHFAIDGMGYIGGGTDFQDWYGDLLKYIPATNSWETAIVGLDSLILTQASTIVQDGKAYILSGVTSWQRCYDEATQCWACESAFCPCVIRLQRTDSDKFNAINCECPLNTLLVYDPVDNSVLPFGGYDAKINERRGGGVFSIENSMYFGGGQKASKVGGTREFDSRTDNCLEDFNRTPFTDFYQFSLDGESIEWTQLADIPGQQESRVNPIGFSIRSKGYMGLGYGPDNDDLAPGPVLTDFYEFDPTQVGSDPWKLMADFPGGPTNAVGFAVAGKGYIISGERDTQKMLWQFDPTDGSMGSWRQVAAIPKASDPFLPQGSFIIGNQAYVYFDFRPDNFWVYIPELE